MEEGISSEDQVVVKPENLGWTKDRYPRWGNVKATDWFLLCQCSKHITMKVDMAVMIKAQSRGE